MTDPADPVHFTAQSPRRQSPRIPGPFEARLVGDASLPVNARDLSTAGCFIDADGHVPIAGAMRIHIDLPGEGWITVQAEAVYRLGHQGVAIKFIALDEPTRERIMREIERTLTQSGL